MNHITYIAVQGRLYYGLKDVLYSMSGWISLSGQRYLHDSPMIYGVPIWAYYLIAINGITCLTFLADKRKAQRHQWRIPEYTLLLLAAAGGSMGALAGMYLFHHKTRKAKFYLGVPLILLLEAGAFMYLYL